MAMAFAGCVQNGTRQESSTVTVSGTGTVSVVPDMVRMTVSMSKVERTTRSAQESVGKMAAQVLAILKDAGVEEKDIATASLRFNPEYEWHGGGSVVPVGQRAEQGIDFAVRQIGQSTEKVARIIDLLTGIDGITMNRVDFGVADNTEHYARSRELAFEKARQKAEQYAELSGLEVGRVLSLSEEGLENMVPWVANNQFRLEEEVAVTREDMSKTLPSGQTEITSQIVVTFVLE